MGIGTKMTDMDASTYQGAFIGKISYTTTKEAAEALHITYEYGDVKENAFMYILSILGKVDGVEAPVEKMTITLVKAQAAGDKSTEAEIRELQRQNMKMKSPFIHFQRKRYTASAGRPEMRTRSILQIIR